MDRDTSKDWTDHWVTLIEAARKGDGTAGRDLIEAIIARLEGRPDPFADEQDPAVDPGYLPSPLAEYVAEILTAALRAEPKKVHLALHINRRKGRRPGSGTVRKAIAIWYVEEHFRNAGYQEEPPCGEAHLQRWLASNDRRFIDLVLSLEKPTAADVLGLVEHMYSMWSELEISDAPNKMISAAERRIRKRKDKRNEP